MNSSTSAKRRLEHGQQGLAVCLINGPEFLDDLTLSQLSTMAAVEARLSKAPGAPISMRSVNSPFSFAFMLVALTIACA